MKIIICLIIFSMCIVPCKVFPQVKPAPAKILKKKKKARIQYGTASFYHNKFNGRRTANGDLFSQKRFTAAHNNVPLGSWLKVTNLSNKKSVIVKVIDRLHHRNRRLIDLSRSAALRIGLTLSGIVTVKVEILGKVRPDVKRK